MTLSEPRVSFVKADYCGPAGPMYEDEVVVTAVPFTIPAKENSGTPSSNIVGTVACPPTEPAFTATTTTYTIPAIPKPDLSAMKKKRKRRTVAWGIVGGVAGLVVLGPLGAVAGGLMGALLTKARCKRREQRVMQCYQQKLTAI
jgi:hypothetical protein